MFGISRNVLLHFLLIFSPASLAASSVLILLSEVEATAQSFYNVTITGDVLQRSFTRTGVVAICPTLIQNGSQNGSNIVDIALISGNPAGIPEPGAIWFSTNSGLVGGRARLDMAFVAYNNSTRTIDIRPDGQIAATGTNLFTASSGVVATPFTINNGQMLLQFDPTFRQINGQISVVGAGFTFSPLNQYNATISGSYAGAISCPIPQ
jgi:hypothetical protein